MQGFAARGWRGLELPDRIARLPIRAPRLPISMRRGLANEQGTAVVEFAMIAPVLVLLLIGTVDFAMAIYDRFALNGAVSAAADYAILNAAEVSSTSEPQLASSLASVASASSNSVVSITAAVNVNHGSTATGTAGAVTATSGSASPATSCYCPAAASGGGVTWGSIATCGSTCSGGGIAGKFVTIAASVAFTSMFGSHGLIPSQNFTTSSVVQVQ